MGTRGLILLVCLACAASADPVTDAADKAREVFRAKGDLKELAAADDPDPWLVADELCARGEFDAAELFAKAAPRKDVERLPEYVAAQRTKPTDTAARRALAAANEALERNDASTTLTVVRSTSPGADVTGTRLRSSRGLALRMQGALDASALSFEEAAGTALALGACGSAATALSEAGLSAELDGNLSRTRELWERRLALEEQRGLRPRLAAALSNLGFLLSRLGETEHGLELQERALALRRDLGDRPGIAISLHNLGMTQGDLGLLQAALAIYEELKDRSGVANALGNIGRCHAKAGDFAKALDSLEGALTMYESFGNHRGAAVMLTNIADVHRRRGEYAMTLELATRALAFSEACGDRVVAAECLNDIGNMHVLLGDYPKATDALERALKLAREGAAGQVALRFREGAVLADLGEVHTRLGNHAQALEYLERAIVNQEAIKHPPGVATVLVKLGVLHRRRGDFARALDCQRRALAIFEEGGDLYWSGVSMGNIGVILGDLGAHAEAMQQFRRARKLMDEGGPRDGVAASLLNIGNTSMTLGDWVEAADCFQQAHRIYEEMGSRSGLAAALGGLASLHARLGDWARALEEAEHALKLHELLGEREELADTLQSIGNIHMALGNPAQALEYQERGLKLSEDLGNRSRIARALEGIGRSHAAQADYPKALEFLQRALGMTRESEDRSVELRILGSLGFLHYRRGEHSRALDDFRKSLDLARDVGEPEQLVWATTFVGRVLLEQPAKAAEAAVLLDEAIARIETMREQAGALGEGGAASAFDALKRFGAFELMASAQLALRRPGEALAYLERGRARDVLDLLERSRFDPLAEAERRAREREGGPMEIAAVREGLAAADRDVCRLTHTLAAKAALKEPDRAGVEAADREMKAARERRAEVLGRRARLVRDVVPVGAPASTAAMQQRLSKDERILFYSLGETGGLLFVVPPPGGEVKAFDLAVSEKDVAKDVEACLASMSRTLGKERGVAGPATETADDGALARLSRALLPPEAWKEIKGCTRVYVVPHGPLFRMPLEALATPEGGTWLERGPAIAYAHSGSVLLWCAKRRDAQRSAKQRYEAVVLGDAVFGPPSPHHFAPQGFVLPPLPGTRKEADAVAATLGKERVALLLGAEATEGSLFRLAPQARYVHLATHQIADERDRGGYSRMALTLPGEPRESNDGFLSLFEVLEGWRDRLSACELVVLSACETAKGVVQRDEGPYAMPLGFLYAGAPAVIGSLWRVDDASTAELFADFYRRLAAGAGKLEAFTEARRALRAKVADPYHWAAFVYIGDPR